MRAVVIREVLPSAVSSLLVVVAVLLSRAVLAWNDDYPWKNVAPDTRLGGSDQVYGLARECVSFVVWRLRNTNHYDITSPGYGDATSWGDNARRHGVSIDANPARGAVAWLPAGHVMWVESVDGDTVTIEDYNFNDGRGWHLYRERQYAKPKLISAGYKFIHFKDLAQGTRTGANASTQPGGGASAAVGGYNNDGNTDVSIFRPSEGAWHIRNGGDIAYGQSGDIPVPGDYDGNGTIEAAVFRPSTHTPGTSGVSEALTGG